MGTQSLAGAPSSADAEPMGLSFDGAQALLRDKYQDDPMQLQASLDALHSQYTNAKVAEATQRIQQQAALGAAIDRVNAALIGGVDTPVKGQALLDQIKGDPAFAGDMAARFDAYRTVRNEIDAQAANPAPRGLGPQFMSALNMLSSGGPMPKPALLAMQANGAITPQGYAALEDALADPAEARMTNAALAAARARRASGGGDQDGDATFARDFLPTFLAQYQAARTAGKLPLELLAPGSNDNIIEPLVSLFGGVRTTTSASADESVAPPVQIASDAEDKTGAPSRSLLDLPGATAVTGDNPQDRRSDCIAECYQLLNSTERPYRHSDLPTNAFFQCVRECEERGGS